jgi:hypothetical protein
MCDYTSDFLGEYVVIQLIWIRKKRWLKTSMLVTIFKVIGVTPMY